MYVCCAPRFIGLTLPRRSHGNRRRARHNDEAMHAEPVTSRNGIRLGAKMHTGRPASADLRMQGPRLLFVRCQDLVGSINEQPCWACHSLERLERLRRMNRHLMIDAQLEVRTSIDRVAWDVVHATGGKKSPSSRSTPRGDSIWCNYYYCELPPLAKPGGCAHAQAVNSNTKARFQRGHALLSVDKCSLLYMYIHFVVARNSSSLPRGYIGVSVRYMGGER
jgi:hypothetical protein